MFKRTTLTTVRISDIKTQNDLIAHAMTPEQAAQEHMQHEPPRYTKGVGQHKGRTYVAAWLLALDDLGANEHCIYLRIDDLGHQTFVHDEISCRQYKAYAERRYQALPQYVRDAVETLFPGCTALYQMDAIATTLSREGLVYGDNTCIAFATPAIASDYLALFPGCEELLRSDPYQAALKLMDLGRELEKKATSPYLDLATTLSRPENLMAYLAIFPDDRPKLPTTERIALNLADLNYPIPTESSLCQTTNQPS